MRDHHTVQVNLLDRFQQVLQAYNRQRLNSPFKAAPLSVPSSLSYSVSPHFDRAGFEKALELVAAWTYLPLKWAVPTVAFHTYQIVFHDDRDNGPCFDGDIAESLLRQGRELLRAPLTKLQRRILQSAVSHVPLNETIHTPAVKGHLLHLGKDQVIEDLKNSPPKPPKALFRFGYSGWVLGPGFSVTTFKNLSIK